jgi:hypothetical protein
VSWGRVPGSRRWLADQKRAMINNTEERRMVLNVYWDNTVKKVCGYINNHILEYAKDGETLEEFVFRHLRNGHKYKFIRYEGICYTTQAQLYAQGKNPEIAAKPLWNMALMRFEIRYLVKTYEEERDPDYWPTWDCRIREGESTHNTLAYGYWLEPKSLRKWLKPHISPFDATIIQRILEKE